LLEVLSSHQNSIGSATCRRLECKSDRRPATGLCELGYFEGKNLKVEYRFGGPQSERLHAIAPQLVELRPDAIVTPGTPAPFAAKRATTTIPIVQLKERRDD
jgi:ABC transporter substrate binding protein